MQPADAANGFDRWILTVRDGLRESYIAHPWLAYGTDWLAFAHIVIAVFFIGPFMDPVRNVWVLRAGIIACVLVIPLALICGAVRQIPFGWRLMDCSFGIFGVVPLLYCLQLTKRLAAAATPVRRGRPATAHTSKPRKRKMSAEGRTAISAAAKARWAKRKAAGKNKL